MAMYEGKTEEEWNKEADKYWRKYLHSGSTDLDAYHEYVTAKQNARHARNMSESGGDTSVTISGSKISNSNSYQRISGTNDNDSITNTGHHATIYGGAGNDNIKNLAWCDRSFVSGGEGDDTIYSAAAGATIFGGAGNDKISLGSSAKNNLIQYAKGDGNDVIYNLGTTDTLSITGSSYSTTKSGNDVIVTVGNGKISLIGAANLSTLNIKGTLSGGSSTDTTPSDSTLKTVTNSTKSPVTIGSAIKTVDASKRTKAVKITGNELANSIKGGSTMGLLVSTPSKTVSRAVKAMIQFTVVTATIRFMVVAAMTVSAAAKAMIISRAATATTFSSTVKATTLSRTSRRGKTKSNSPTRQSRVHQSAATTSSSRSARAS